MKSIDLSRLSGWRRAGAGLTQGGIDYEALANSSVLGYRIIPDLYESEADHDL
jgi:hypothetical protein